MNCTFFTRKSAYDRRRNLDIVCKAIQSTSNAMDVRVNERDDIVVNGADSLEDKKVCSLIIWSFQIQDKFYSVEYLIL